MCEIVDTGLRAKKKDHSDRKSERLLTKYKVNCEQELVTKQLTYQELPAQREREAGTAT